MWKYEVLNAGLRDGVTSQSVIILLYDAIAACESVQISMKALGSDVYIVANMATISANVDEGKCDMSVALKESDGQFWSICSQAIPIWQLEVPIEMREPSM